VETSIFPNSIGNIHLLLHPVMTLYYDIIFTEQLNDFFLTQVNTLPTRGNNILDLIITSLPDQIENISKLKPMDIGLFTDHETILFNLKKPIKAAPKLNRTVFDYRRGNMDGLRSALAMIENNRFRRRY
jgi:hypothetical protein